MIADILFELAWKSSILIAAVLGLVAGMRGHSPASRVAVGALGLTVLLLLPTALVVMAWFPLPTLSVTAPEQAAAALPMLTDPAVLAALAGATATAEPTTVQWPVVEMIAAVWTLGALIVLGRLLAGLATLRSWTRSAELCVSAEWNAYLRACGAPDSTELRISREVPSPLSWGWRRPVILFNPNLPFGRTDSEAVIAHEAAHIARGDWPRLIVARLVVALFWFNPLVWLLERAFLQAVEEAADAEATSRVEPTLYAQALLNAARHSFLPQGANSMAAGTLSKRIHRVLSRPKRSRWEGTWRTGALTGVVVIAGPLAAVQFVAPAMSAAIAATPLAPKAISAVLAPLAPTATPAAVAAPAPAAPRVVSGTVVLDSGGVPIAPVAPVAPVAVATAAAVHPHPSIAPVAIDEDAIRAAVEAAAEARASAAVVSRDARREADRIRAEVAASMVSMRAEMRRGADEMERGAIEMRRGAAEMREEARKLRDPGYRAHVIAEAKANRGSWGNGKWGDHVPTDQELLAAIPKMEKGADKMDAGVDKMREGARRMREEASRND